MRHLDLWLQKYTHRRSQILSNWAGMAKSFDDYRMRIPAQEVVTELGETSETPTMCFVDGGEGLRELMGLAVYFVRASALYTSKDSDKKEETFIRDLDLNVIAYDEHTKERVELLREAMEFEVASKCISSHNPDIVFLDGSLYVKSRRKPIKIPEYQLYRKRFVRLLKLSKETGTRLVGVSEDSKSRMLSNHLSTKYQVKLPKYVTDATLLGILAGKKPYMTNVFHPCSKFEAGKGLEDNIVAGFPTTYVKPTNTAAPLRVDVPDWEKDIEEIAATISNLCRGSGRYGYPVPLYLAHLDAHIPPSQMEWTVKQIVNYLSKRDNLLADFVLASTRRCARPS